MSEKKNVLDVLNGSGFERIDWGIEADKLEFVKRQDLPKDKAFKFNGIYIAKNRGYGATPVVLLDNARVYLPTTMLNNVKSMLESEDKEAYIEQIKSGELGVEFYEYENKDKRKCVGAKFVELEG